jgi:hypothetical protein
MIGVTPGRPGSFVRIRWRSLRSKARARYASFLLAYILLYLEREDGMLADLLIGLTLWTATSVLAAISLGRILQRGKAQLRRHSENRADEHPLSDVA